MAAHNKSRQQAGRRKPASGLRYTLDVLVSELARYISILVESETEDVSSVEFLGSIQD